MKELVMGFLGCGNVGGGVWKLLQGYADELDCRQHLTIRVKKVLVRSLNKQRSCDVPREILTDNPDDVLLDPEITLVAEFMGGEHPATEYMLKALENGKTVVTANKVALALNWHLLQAAAEKSGVGLYYEASVGGAIPIIGALTQSLQANRISSIMGIINGTTNYILSRMTENGEDYQAVLADAQKLGLAEPDPTSDVEGMDAAYKLSIMASLAFHTRVTYDKVYREGITKVTAADIAWGRKMGYVVKLLAVAKQEGNKVEVRVHPAFLPKEHPLAGVNGSFNAVYLYGHACKEMMLQGRGAGDMPTASAIVGDILQAVKAEGHYPYPTFANTAEPDPATVFDDNWTAKYFVRLSAADGTDALSYVAACFAKAHIAIEGMTQETAHGQAQMMLVTGEAKEQAVQSALSSLDPSLCTVENLIRIEA
ncbi:MAG: homoserine dehydrogenase [Clostridia bacterium]|nr:homoserine dehydrogenase [Clostridia bacterium]